jgi:hypothetical protein
VIDPVQLRMARAALGWTLQQLSERAKVHLNTVRRCELGYETLTGTMQKIEEVFRKEGVIFIDETDDAGPGIRLGHGRNLKSASTRKPGNPKVTSRRKKI